MAVPFAETTRALRTDRFRRTGWTLATCFALIAAWTCWLFLARITLVLHSDEARLEAKTHALQSPVPGQIASVHVVLGEEVEAGNPILTLVLDDARLKQAELSAERGAIDSRLSAMRVELERMRSAHRHAEHAHLAQLEAQRENVAALDSVQRSAVAEARRLELLRDESVIAAAIVEQAQSEAEQAAAATRAQRQRVRQSQARWQQQDAESQGRIEQLLGEIKALNAEQASSAAQMAGLEHELQRRVLRAPVRGRIADLTTLRAGSVVEAGVRLGTIVPGGELVAVAYVPVARAAGKVLPQQPARMHLHGFSWTRYGALQARVLRVASEADQGRLRVELLIESGSVPRIPLQHGLTGSMDIDIERVNPATLLLRHAAGLLRP